MKYVFLVLAVLAVVNTVQAEGDSVFLYNPNYSSQGVWMLGLNADNIDEGGYLPKSVESGGITHFGDTMGPSPYLGLPKDPNIPMVGDVNGDGLDDLVLLGLDADGQDSLLVKFTGSVDTAGNISLTKLSPGGHIAQGLKLNIDHKAVFMADVTGDGMDDVICKSTSNNYWVAYHSNSDGSGFAQAPDTWRSGNAVGSRLFKGDFNGDGVMDVGEHKINGTNYMALSWLSKNGIGLSDAADVYSWSNLKPISAGPLAAVLCGDVNGDGKDDLVEIIDSGLNWLARIYLARAGGTTPSKIDFAGNYSWSTFSKNLLGSAICDIVPMIGDVNDDGFADLIFYDEFIHTDNLPHGRLKVIYGDGNVPHAATYTAWNQTANAKFNYYGYYGTFGQDFRGFIPMLGKAHSQIRTTDSDINADGVVDMADFSWVALNWLTLAD